MAKYYKCENCQYETDDIEDLKESTDLCNRLTIGETIIVPAGDCPECGAFCYVHKRYYNHALTLVFTVVSEHDGEHITIDEFKQGLKRRIRILQKNPSELEEAAHCELPYDSYPTGHEEFLQWQQESLPDCNYDQPNQR